MAVFRRWVSIKVTKGRRWSLIPWLYSYQKVLGQRHTHQVTTIWNLRLLDGEKIQFSCWSHSVYGTLSWWPQQTNMLLQGPVPFGLPLMGAETIPKWPCSRTCSKAYISLGLLPSVSRMSWVVFGGFEKYCFWWMEAVIFSILGDHGVRSWPVRTGCGSEKPFECEAYSW